MNELADFFKNTEPHRLTKRSAARMAVRHEINPLTGRPTGGRYVDPLFVAGLERLGYDPAPFIEKLLAYDAEEDE